MAILLYMDQPVPRAITMGLRRRGIDVLTAYEDNASDWADAVLLDRAKTLGRVLFTRDDDLLAEAIQRQREKIPYFTSTHPGIQGQLDKIPQIAMAGLE